jgi:cupin 2 domain-containing protein
MKNLFNTSGLDPAVTEVFQTLHTGPHCRIERIVTQKPYSEPGEWYDQEEDEWVVLLEGSATLDYRDGRKVELNRGDYLFLPAHKVHRIISSSPGSHCVWLAIHGNLQ